MKKLFPLLLFALTLFGACSKEKTNGTTSIVPTNLVVNADVKQDSTGNVSFTATATNAVTYEYDYGNGIYATVVSGAVTYKYQKSGSYLVKVIAKSSTGQTITKSVQITVTVELRLVWSDEFNTNGAPDPAKWGYDLGNNNGWGNNELEYYTNRPENVIVQNGVLKINAIREFYMGNTFTSTRLLSKDKYAFTYGKVEARAKLPAGVGTWPAIWMLGSNINTVSWPGCGEIDIMEHVGKNLNRIYATLHYPGRSGGSADGNSLVINNATTAFHVYKLEWDASDIKIFVDDMMIHSVPNSNSKPFNQNFFFILNVAMGGDFGGPVDASVSNATMEVDYIRVFQ
jgi:beta-glucanase (GH16 family)